MKKCLFVLGKKRIIPHYSGKKMNEFWYHLACTRYFINKLDLQNINTKGNVFRKFMSIWKCKKRWGKKPYK